MLFLVLSTVIILSQLQNSKRGRFAYICKGFDLAEGSILLIFPRILPRSPRDSFGGRVNKQTDEQK